MPADDSAFPVLYVDDERENLVAFRYALGERFHVITAESGPQALEVLEREEVAVLMCDQRMPTMSGTEVCRRARSVRPEAVRIIVTAYADLQSAVDAINQGQVMRYVTKPWRNDEMEEVLRSSIELVQLQKTVAAMQSRLLRSGPGVALEAVQEELLRALQDPVSMLDINVEQVRDLLAAGLSRWQDPDHARALLTRAREAHDEADVPLQTLRQTLGRLRQRQPLDPQVAAAPTDVGRAVRATTSILKAAVEPGARLRVVLSASPVVRMPASALAQVLVNLVMNAAQAIAAAGRSDGLITVEVASRGGEALISVRDNGPGLAAEQQTRVFDPFYGDSGGAGLGLPVARHLVAQAGGTLEARDGAGSGAVFQIALPLVGADDF